MSICESVIYRGLTEAVATLAGRYIAAYRYVSCLQPNGNFSAASLLLVISDFTRAD